MAKDKDSRDIRAEDRHLIVNLVNRLFPWSMIDESTKLKHKNAAWFSVPFAKLHFTNVKM